MVREREEYIQGIIRYTSVKEEYDSLLLQQDMISLYNLLDVMGVSKAIMYENSEYPKRSLEVEFITKDISDHQSAIE